MYHQIFHIANITFYCLLAIGTLLFSQKIIYHVVGLFPGKKLPEAKANHKYAVLIPARNESKVIEQLLVSIQEQSYSKDLVDTYIIVESEDDPTCQIAKQYPNTHVFVRRHLELKGKGYALNEVIQHIFKNNKKYDAYFICDADNVLSKDFIFEMNKAYDAGYKIALGYRNSKNWNDGWVAACSALTFSTINTFQNKCRSRLNSNVIISGTGFYIAGEILEKLGGWSFYTLTEDYELSMYSALNNIKSIYVEQAEFYDEQPTKVKVSWNQRLRWVKGFGQANKKYKKKLITSLVTDKQNKWSKAEFSLSIVPIMIMLATTFVYCLFCFGFGVYGLIVNASHWRQVLVAFGVSASAIYVFFALYTALLLFAERKHTNITTKNAIITCLMGPWFLGLYIPIYITALFKKEVKWVPIVHSVNMNKESGETIEIKLEESESAQNIE